MNATVLFKLQKTWPAFPVESKRYEDLCGSMAVPCTDPVCIGIVLVLFLFPYFSVRFHALLSQFAMRAQSSVNKPRLSQYKFGSFMPEKHHKNYIT